MAGVLTDAKETFSFFRKHLEEEKDFVTNVGLIFAKLIADERIPIDIAEEYSNAFLKIHNEYVKSVKLQ